eukprot:1878526-Rhodomonas_salina.4
MQDDDSFLKATYTLHLQRSKGRLLVLSSCETWQRQGPNKQVDFLCCGHRRTGRWGAWVRIAV